WWNPSRFRPSRTQPANKTCLLTLQLVQQGAAGGGQFRRQPQGLSGSGVRQGQLMRMQEHAVEPQTCEPGARLVRPVFVVAHDGKTTGRQMHPNLVGASGAQLGVNQAEFPQAPL